MKKQDRCKPLIHHINRMQGQMDGLKKYLEQEKSCEEIARLAVSISNSFDTLKSSLAEGFVREEILQGKKVTPKNEGKLKALKRLIKS